MVNGAQNVVDIARGQLMGARVNSAADSRQIFGVKRSVALWLYLAIADIDRGNLVHLDTALAVFGINPKHQRPIFTYPEVIIRQFTRHKSPASN
jgi:hypothetical protein